MIIGESSQELLENFKGAQTIHPIAQPGPSQRGPNCGFYGLAYVLKYWHERHERLGGNYKVEKPLDARTENAVPLPKQRWAVEKAPKAIGAAFGKFSSLRHYGKYHKLTAYGSVFDAGDLVKVAKGENSQYAGQFDGMVVKVESPAHFERVVTAMLDIECPVIVPFDVGDKGEPGSFGGERAHWIVMVGYRGAEAVYYNWGKFHKADIAQFAVSNGQLSSNKIVKMAKFERIDPRNNRVAGREYSSAAGRDQSIKNGWKMEQVGDVILNPEYNDPDKKGLKWPGKDRLQTGGLRDRLVIVFRAEDRGAIDGALPT